MIQEGSLGTPKPYSLHCILYLFESSIRTLEPGLAVDCTTARIHSVNFTGPGSVSEHPVSRSSEVESWIQIKCIIRERREVYSFQKAFQKHTRKALL